MKKNYLINLDMENNATIDDYYEELMYYKKLGVLARAKYKGEYVYTNEYSIKNKLYEIELKNNEIGSLKKELSTKDKIINKLQADKE